MMENRRVAPAAERNKEPILSVLRMCLPERGTVLEVAAGTGQHAPFFIDGLAADLSWLATDADPDNLDSIDAYRQDAPERIWPGQVLDVHERPWRLDVPDLCAIVAINMVHISPWSASEALVAEAGARLPEGGVLYLYGPYKVGGAHTAESNADFDNSLRGKNPQWGIRDVDDIAELATAAGFAPPERHAMPANNFSLILRKRGG